jgi:excisionase family DNA binding protein
MSNIEETVTPQEAATLLGIDIRTVREWISEGRIEAIKLPGNRWRIPKSALQGRMAEAPGPAKMSVPKLSMKRYCHGFEVPDNFDLITTYEELSQYTRAFGNRKITLLLLVGSPGSGKSRQVKSDLNEKKHAWIDNHATNLGLYCSVYEANCAPLVLDDINHLFKSKMACSLMKALTQTEKTRSRSWRNDRFPVDSKRPARSV